jgi:hypothetical protein
MKDFNQFFNESVIVRDKKEFLRKLIAYTDKVQGVLSMGQKELGPTIEKEAIGGEREGRGLVVQGPDLTIYFAKIGTGKIKKVPGKEKQAYFDQYGNPVMEKEPTEHGDVIVAFKDIKGNFTQVYIIPDSDLDWIKDHFS